MMDDVLPWLRSCKCQQYNCAHKQSADEIERLRAEVERLTDALNNARTGVALLRCERLEAAGDALAKQITKPCRCVEAHDGAINETCAPCAACFDWQEARRG